mgnify:CR=1 FL=1
MRPKADTDDGWFKIADDLAQALARAQLSATEYGVVFWVMCHTYGVRKRVDGGKFAAQKFVFVPRKTVARQLGRDHKLLKRSLSSLVARGVLKASKAGAVGFNTNLMDWNPGLNGAGWGAMAEAREALGITCGQLEQGGVATPPRGGQDYPPPGGSHAPLRGVATPPPLVRARGRGEYESTSKRTAHGLNRCSYNDQGQGPCRDEVVAGSKYCQPHKVKVGEKFNDRGEKRGGGFASAKDVLKTGKFPGGKP